jgi:hypothetical protein
MTGPWMKQGGERPIEMQRLSLLEVRELKALFSRIVTSQAVQVITVWIERVTECMRVDDQ